MSIFAGILADGSLQPPILYGISARQLFPALNPEQYLEKLFQTRVQIIQWREKDLPRELNLPLIRRGAELGRQTGKLFVVNTLISDAWNALADGAHLTGRQDETQALATIPDRSRRFVIGKSVHSSSEARNADTAGVDYLLLAPILPTLSKRSSNPTLGWEGLREICELVGCPVFALGGVTLEDAGRSIDSGAVGIAGISWLASEIEQLTS